MNEREYAAQKLLGFLQQVGPIEAIWAMTTALEALMEPPAGGDHVAAVAGALDESLAEFSELALAEPAPVEPPPAVISTEVVPDGGEGEQKGHSD